MAEAYQTTRWKTFDGRDFATEAEASTHEDTNFVQLLAGLTVEGVQAAVERDPRVLAVSNAIERAAYLIAKARREAGDLRRRPKGSGSEPPAEVAADQSQTEEAA